MPLSRLDKRGVSRSSRTLRRDAMDALAAQDERRLKRTAKSCGPDTPTLVSSFRRFSPAGATVAKKPGRRGEHEISRKPCAGNAGSVRCDRGDYARMLFLFCMRGCGRNVRPVFPAPSVIRGQQLQAKLARPARRDREVVSAAV